MPISNTASRMAHAHRMARAGPSKVTKKPSPAVSTSTPRKRRPRQALKATIGWSYGLLNEYERLLWARLSVFARGFKEEAAVQVCSDERIPAGRITGLLGALVDKSILKRRLRDGGRLRWVRCAAVSRLAGGTRKVSASYV